MADLSGTAAIMGEGWAWKESYSVGHHLLDAQHKKILSLIAAADRCLSDNTSDSDAQFRLILNELGEYARAHFDFEESLLRHIGFPMLKDQIHQHDQYLERLNSILQSLSQGMSDKQGLRNLLIDWWKHHILEHDMQYKRFLVES